MYLEVLLLMDTCCLQFDKLLPSEQFDKPLPLKMVLDLSVPLKNPQKIPLSTCGRIRLILHGIPG